MEKQSEFLEAVKSASSRWLGELLPGTSVPEASAVILRAGLQRLAYAKWSASAQKAEALSKGLISGNALTLFGRKPTAEEKAFRVRVAEAMVMAEKLAGIPQALAIFLETLAPEVGASVRASLPAPVEVNEPEPEPEPAPAEVQEPARSPRARARARK